MLSRADLISPYIGQTSIKTCQILESFGIAPIFITEAHNLCLNKEDIFGLQCLETIHHFMLLHSNTLYFVGNKSLIQEMLLAWQPALLDMVMITES